MSAKAKIQGGARRGPMRGEGRHQAYLLPEPIADDLGEATPARFWAAFVAPLDREQ